MSDRSLKAHLFRNQIKRRCDLTCVRSVKLKEIITNSAMEETTVQTESWGHTTSNVTSLESFSCNKRLLEDIGGQNNLTMFMTLLSRYVEDSELQVIESSNFIDTTSKTEINFSYAYHNCYLFGKFLELSPVYMGAAWFVQLYNSEFWGHKGLYTKCITER